MRYLCCLIALLFLGEANAQTITVTNVKVSVTAESAATARDQALDQAYAIAFQKLLAENFPEKMGSLPSQDTLMNMVLDFSIEREKTTPKTYAASLSFQFDNSKVHAWLQQKQPSITQTISPPHTGLGGKTLKVNAFYSTLFQWQLIKKALETSPGIQKVKILAFSPQNAKLEVVYDGSQEKMQQYLAQQALTVSPEGEQWVISTNRPLR